MLVTGDNMGQLSLLGLDGQKVCFPQRDVSLLETFDCFSDRSLICMHLLYVLLYILF